MKITTLFVLAACLQVSAKGFSQNITYSGTNVPLTTVFSVIEKQTSYNVVYNPDWLDKAKTVSVVANNVPVETFLRQTLKDLPFDFSIQNTTIILSRKPVVSNSSQEIPMAPPPFPISGRVTNGDGNPLSGASVTNKSSKVSVATDADGRFSINSNEGDVLAITYVGYSSIGFKITSSTTAIVVSSDLQSSGTDDVNTTGITYRVGQTLSFSSGLNIVLSQKISSLTEVVINKGYYTEAKRFSTGNVSQISSKDIEKQPVQNPLLALQGRVTGIQITQLTGLNGGGVTLRIQGQNSINAGLNPLIVVDGVPYPSNLLTILGRDNLVQGGSPLNYINPSDIESIDILKDADATSIYGSRAANGAILITTKKGKSGKTKVSINFQQGWGKATRHIDMMNTRQYLDMRYEAFRNDNQIPSKDPNAFPQYAPDLTLWDTTRYTDWQKELIGGTAKYTNVNASISGGNSGVQYLIGTTYKRQTTVFPCNFDDKVGGVHFNINSNSTDKKLSIQFSASYLYDNNHLPFGDLTQNALFLEPDAPPLYNKDGTLNWAPNASGTSTWTNPLALISGEDYNKITKNLISNLDLSYTIISGLTIGGTLGYTNLQGSNYSPVRLEANAPEYRATSLRSAFFGKQDLSNWTIEPQLKYAHKFGSGNIEGLIGGSFQKQNGDFEDISASGYVNDQLMASPGAAPNKNIVSTSFVYKYNAFFGRLNYNWKQKYVLNLTARRDGSSRFGDNNKFHNFGSIGAAWIFSEEKFVQKNISFLSFGKLRGSFGATGNDQISDYIYLSIYGTSNPVIPYQGGSGLVVTGIPNPYLQWEETQKRQSGVDLGFLNDRILIGATYSRNQSSNELIYYSLPSTTGFTLIQENFPAAIRNTSWEFTLHTINFKRKNFSWSIDLNLTIPKNKLVSFPNIQSTSYADGNQGVIVGQPLGVKKTYNHGGVDPTTGYYYPLNKDGNPVYYPNRPSSALDRTVIISPSTKYYGGFINTIGYRGFQLEFVLQFVKQKGYDDFDYWNGSFYPGAFGFGRSNQPSTLVNKIRWQKAGDNAEIGKYSIYNTVNGRIVWPAASDLPYTYNASFIRLKNVSLSWQMPKNWIKKAELQSATLFFHGENLATITKYKGLDPESQSNKVLPPLRIWTIGAQLDF